MDVPPNLPQIENYSQKKELIQNIKSGKIIEDFKLQKNNFEQ